MKYLILFLVSATLLANLTEPLTPCLTAVSGEIEKAHVGQEIASCFMSDANPFVAKVAVEIVNGEYKLADLSDAGVFFDQAAIQQCLEKKIGGLPSAKNLMLPKECSKTLSIPMATAQLHRLNKGGDVVVTTEPGITNYPQKQTKVENTSPVSDAVSIVGSGTNEIANALSQCEGKLPKEREPLMLAPLELSISSGPVKKTRKVTGCKIENAPKAYGDCVCEKMTAFQNANLKVLTMRISGEVVTVKGTYKSLDVIPASTEAFWFVRQVKSGTPVYYRLKR